MTFEELSQVLEYSPLNGAFFLLKTKTKKRVFPSDGFLLFTLGDKKKRMKANRIAFILFTGSDIPQGSVILHRNLDQEDYTWANLALVSRDIMRQISEAIWNLSGGLRYEPHPKDAYSYFLYFKRKGMLRKVVVSDVSTVQKMYRRLQLVFTKTLGKYTVSSDN